MKSTATVLAAFLVFIGGASLSAQGFGGSVESRAGWYWSHDELESLTQVVNGNVSGIIGPSEAPGAQYRAELRAQYDPLTGSSTIGLRDAWVKAFVGPLDISLGNQVVAWSVSDVFYPSDVVNPWDNSNPVDQERIPVPMARVVLNGSFFSVDLVAVPYWISGVLPDSRWATPSQKSLAALTHDSAADETPVFDWENVAYGGHVKGSFDLLSGLDIGVTFYRGRSSTPTDVVLEYTGMYPTGYHYAYDSQTMLGADVALATGGGLVLKTEWAYTTLGDTDIFSPQVGKARMESVSGFEYVIGTAQIEGEYVLDWAKGSTEDTFAHKAIAVITWDIDNRTSIRVAGSWDFSGNGGGLLSPELGFTVADGVKISLEAYAFFGDSTSTYGSYIDNSLGRIGLSCSF